LVLAACIASAYVHSAFSQSSTRQEEVRQKGSVVMPFDLARTRHFFDDTPTGGVETVTANDKGDAKQIELIRAHLRSEAERFARGDFSDPAAIHGHEMPGLASLASSAARLQVKYKELANGASITFASRDKSIVAAVHEWFAAQRMDHGAHAHLH
jgi:hypothetical protein